MTWALHVGDCLDPVTGLASLPDKSVDHVICDPPYEAEAHTRGRRAKRAGGVAEEPLDFAPITEAQRDEAAGHFARLARRWVVVFCQVEAAMKWRGALEAVGAVYKRTGFWHKPDGQPQLTGDRPGMGYETMVFAHAPGRSRWNGGGRTAVWSMPKHEAIRFGHQTQKPTALMEELVRLFTDPGELVLDPFAGSGTTGVAAVRHGRRFVGWEMNEKYAEIARRRIGSTREQMGLFTEIAK